MVPWWLAGEPALERGRECGRAGGTAPAAYSAVRCLIATCRSPPSSAPSWTLSGRPPWPRLVLCLGPDAIWRVPASDAHRHRRADRRITDRDDGVRPPSPVAPLTHYPHHSSRRDTGRPRPAVWDSSRGAPARQRPYGATEVSGGAGAGHPVTLGDNGRGPQRQRRPGQAGAHAHNSAGRPHRDQRWRLQPTSRPAHAAPGARAAGRGPGRATLGHPLRERRWGKSHPAGHAGRDATEPGARLGGASQRAGSG